MSHEPSGLDQFQSVANRRAGYTAPVEWALRIAKKGGTLAAGEGLLIVEHYEDQLAQLREQLAKKTEAYRASVVAAEAERWKEFFYAAREKAERMERVVEEVAGLAEVDVINGGEYYDDIAVQPVLAAYHRYALNREAQL